MGLFSIVRHLRKRALEMTDREIINAYFADPAIRAKLDEELGKNGRITVDWERRMVIAKGRKSGRQWDLDEMLAMLKEKSVSH